MITEFYKVCTIRLAGESVSGKMSVGTLLYVYHVDSSTLNRELMDFIDSFILDSVRKIYPQAMPKSNDYYGKDQLKDACEDYLKLKSIELLFTPKVASDDLNRAAMRQVWYDRLYPLMPVMRVKVYMEESGSPDDIYSPFNEFDLKYPSKMEPQDEPLIKALSDFVGKTIVRLEDVLLSNKEEYGKTRTLRIGL